MSPKGQRHYITVVCRHLILFAVFSCFIKLGMACCVIRFWWWHRRGSLPSKWVTRLGRLPLQQWTFWVYMAVLRSIHRVCSIVFFSILHHKIRQKVATNCCCIAINGFLSSLPYLISSMYNSDIQNLLEAFASLKGDLQWTGARSS